MRAVRVLGGDVCGERGLGRSVDGLQVAHQGLSGLAGEAGADASQVAQAARAGHADEHRAEAVATPCPWTRGATRR